MALRRPLSSSIISSHSCWSRPGESASMASMPGADGGKRRLKLMCQGVQQHGLQLLMAARAFGLPGAFLFARPIHGQGHQVGNRLHGGRGNRGSVEAQAAHGSGAQLNRDQRPIPGRPPWHDRRPAVSPQSAFRNSPRPCRRDRVWPEGAVKKSYAQAAKNLRDLSGDRLGQRGCRTALHQAAAQGVHPLDFALPLGRLEGPLFQSRGQFADHEGGDEESCTRPPSSADLRFRRRAPAGRNSSPGKACSRRKPAWLPAGPKAWPRPAPPANKSAPPWCC